MAKGTANELLKYIGSHRANPYASPFTYFHELRTSTFNPQIERDPSHGLDFVYRDTLTGTGAGGGASEVDGTIKLNTGTDQSANYALRTKERGRVQPGIQAVAGYGQYRPVAPKDDQEWFGEYGDGTDGMRFGEDASGLNVRAIRHGTPEAKVYQTDWNVDPLDGTGPSGVTLYPDQLFIVRNPFTHYGAGPEEVDVFTAGQYGEPRLVTVHYFDRPKNQISFSTPRLPLRHYVSNGTTGEDFTIYIGGRHFAVEGNYDPDIHPTIEEIPVQTIAGGTEAIIASFQKKSLRKFLTRPVRLSKISAVSNKNGRLKAYINTTLSGTPIFGSLNTAPDAQTALEIDTAATGFSGGALLRAATTAASKNTLDKSAERVLVDIPEDSIVTLTYENFDGTDATVYPLCEFEEEA